eukprot:5064777-Pyramimonas_sp.AAC.2
MLQEGPGKSCEIDRGPLDNLQDGRRKGLRHRPGPRKAQECARTAQEVVAKKKKDLWVNLKTGPESSAKLTGTPKWAPKMLPECRVPKNAAKLSRK